MKLDAFAFAVVMGFEAFRICIGQRTKKHNPQDVMRWMRAVLRHTPGPLDAARSAIAKVRQ